MGRVPGRVVKWAGGLLTLVTASVMGAYFADVGLDKADKLASVIGAFIALAGIALAVYGTITAGAGRPAGSGNEPGAPSDTGSVHNEIVSGTFHSLVVQSGRDALLGPQPAPSSPPDEPDITQKR